MSDPGLNIVTCDSAVELAERLAEDVAALLAAAILKRGRAQLVVSGGSTPELFFKNLSQREINWEKVVITLTDERWVDPSDSSSNEHLVRSLLLQKAAARARFVGLKNAGPTALAGEKKCNEVLAEVQRPFDLVILGMGKDGHTASLFPGAARLAAALDMLSGSDCMAISPPQGPFERMTLTLPALLDSRKIILHITGADKKAALETALAGGPASELPVRGILSQQKTPVQIYWAP